MTETTPRPLHPTYAVGAAVFFVLLAFPSSLWGLAQIAMSPIPEALSLGVVVIAALWTWVIFSVHEEVRPLSATRDEKTVAIAVLAATAMLAWLWRMDELNNRHIWHPDILTLPVFAAALALAYGGVQGVRRFLGPLLLLLLAWVPLAAKIGATITPPMHALAEWGGVLLARGTGVQIEAVANTPHLVRCTGSAGTIEFLIAEQCSGVNSLLAILVIVAPVVFQAEGAPRRKAVWAGLGCALMVLFAPVRVALLSHVGAAYGASALYDVFHFVGGMGFFVIAWAMMLGLTRVVGLSPPQLMPPPQESRRAPGTPAGWATLAGIGAIALFAGVGNYRHHVKSQLPRPTAASVAVDVDRVESWLPAVAGYRFGHYRTFDWARALYGARSRMERFAYESDQGGTLWVDVLVLPDWERLKEYTALGCYQWHDDQILRARAFLLADGVPGRAFAVRENKQLWVVLAWIERATAYGAPRWRRIVARRLVREPEAIDRELEALIAFAGHLVGRAGEPGKAPPPAKAPPAIKRSITAPPVKRPVKPPPKPRPRKVKPRFKKKRPPAPIAFPDPDN